MKGCLGSVLVLLAFLVLAIAGLVLQAQQPSKDLPDYVALGSSFAAGADLGPLQKGSPLLCARSVNGYPEQLARMRGLSIVDMTCGGATAKQVLRGGQFFQGPQIRTIGAGTRLVTLTVGGNDIGYIGDLSLLAARKSHTPFGWLVSAFWKGPQPPAERDYGALHRALLATLNDIHKRAPRATIVMATYPAILPRSGTCLRLGLSAAEVDLMRQVASQLASTTMAAANEGGAVLVDLNKIGAAHDACSAAPWTRGWTNAGAAPFHPTLLGAEETAKAISKAIR